jgi:hypothetical protein
VRKSLAISSSTAFFAAFLPQEAAEGDERREPRSLLFPLLTLFHDFKSTFTNVLLAAWKFRQCFCDDALRLTSFVR